MRRKSKVDRNQPKIVSALRKAGCSVAVTSTAGKGFPDIVVGLQGKNYMIEIKDGEAFPSDRKLNKRQKKFHSTWKGQIDVALCVDDALEIVGLKSEN